MLGNRIEYGHSLAAMARVTSSGPVTLRGIVNAHFSLRRQALDIMNQQPPTFSQKYSLSPISRGIIIILDRPDLDFDFDFDNDNLTEPDGHIKLKKLPKTQTVLLARTGLTEGPSKPISIESRKPRSLPLKRTGINTRDDSQRIRVYLASAVQFIIDLKISEDSATQYSTDRRLSRNGSLRPFPPKGVSGDTVCYEPAT